MMSWNCLQGMRTVISRYSMHKVPNLFSRYVPVCHHHSILNFNVQGKWGQPKIDSGLHGHQYSKHFIRNKHVIHMRGLDWEAKEQDVIDFFKPLSIVPSKISLRCDISGRTSGVCEVVFDTHAEAVTAMRKRNAFIGNRFIRLNLKSSAEDENADNEINTSNINGAGGQATDEKSYATGHFIRMGNLPTRITQQTIFQFFWPLNVRPTSVQPVYDENEYHTGEFDVEFLSHEDAVKAMSKNNTCIGHRFVELTLYSDVSPVPRPPMYKESTTPSEQSSDYERINA